VQYIYTYMVYFCSMQVYNSSGFHYKQDIQILNGTYLLKHYIFGTITYFWESVWFIPTAHSIFKWWLVKRNLVNAFLNSAFWTVPKTTLNTKLGLNSKYSDPLVILHTLSKNTYKLFYHYQHYDCAKHTRHTHGKQ